MLEGYRISSTVKIIGVCLGICILVILLLTFPDIENEKRLKEFDEEEIARRRLEWNANFSKLYKRQGHPVNCFMLVRDDPDELIKAASIQDANPKKPVSEADYITSTKDCKRFLMERDYYLSPPLSGEEDFPLAFDIVAYKDIEQIERLLRAVYRSQNSYCVHIDSKSSSDLHLAVKSISKCFDNVFVIENPISVKWGTYSVLEPDILCMEALLKYKKWKYFINLTGQEFPLKTNWELVQILKAVNGANLVASTKKKVNQERLEGRPPPPIPVTPYKGSVHVLVRREFVEYAINSEDGKKFQNWTKLVGHSSEYFFSTLNHNPQLGIPGSYLGTPETYDKAYQYPFINRYKMWKESRRLICYGKFVRSICIFGVGDLQYLAASRFLFANKFHLDYHPLAYDCLEEMIYNRTIAERLGQRNIDTTFYSELKVTKNHI